MTLSLMIMGNMQIKKKLTEDACFIKETQYVLRASY